MTVQELIAALQTHDPDALVVCQADPEGNSYSPLEGVEVDGYEADSTYYGERFLLELTPELEQRGYSEDDVSATAVKAVFLVPVN